MKEKKTVRVKGSAIITADNEVYFTPYKKIPIEEAKWKVLVAGPGGIIRSTDNVIQIRMTYDLKSINKSKMVDDFIHLIFSI